MNFNNDDQNKVTLNQKGVQMRKLYAQKLAFRGV